MNIKNLLKDSDAYYNKNDYYEIFSKAEDKENKVADYLKNKVNNKIVLDAGCGTGKFLKIIEKRAKKYIGVDLSFNQLIKAQEKSSNENSIFIKSNLKDIMLEKNSVDLIISPWVLGTITELNERSKCLEELKRILKPKGKIYLIENDINSEFEVIRGHDKDLKTQKYNQWILDNGFKINQRINTFMGFNSLKEAKKCFVEIYGKEKAEKIYNSKIEHKIVIFEYIK